MNCNNPTIIWESIFAKMYKFLLDQYFFPIFACKYFKVKSKNVNDTRNTSILVKIFTHIVVGYLLSLFMVTFLSKIHTICHNIVIRTKNQEALKSD